MKKIDLAIMILLAATVLYLGEVCHSLRKERDSLQAQIHRLRELKGIVSIDTEIDTVAHMDVLATNEVDTPAELTYFFPALPAGATNNQEKK